MTRMHYLGFLTFIFLLLCAALPANTLGADEPQIIPVTPMPNEILTTTTPVITVRYHSNTSSINPEGVQIWVDNLDVTTLEETTINSTELTYSVPSVLELKNGAHTIRVKVSDMNGNWAERSWNFTVDTNYRAEIKLNIDWKSIAYYVLGGSFSGLAAFGLYILYLRKAKRFTFKKYFKKNPMKKFYITIIIPSLIAFFFVITASAYIVSIENPPAFSFEYVLVVAIFISLTAYTVDVVRSRRRLERQERAFAQFLFEMADAIRGGLHPAKVIVELSKTSSGALQKELRIAADNIRIGKPFDEVINAMSRNINSSLVNRYSTLIGESAKIGGEIASVIHRAARDMDDMIKIRDERRRQLTMVASIIYIGFGITAVVLYLLALMYPSLGEIDLSILGLTSVEGGKTSTTAYLHLGLSLVKERFFHLLLITGIGSGCLIGLFKEGSAREGLIHSLIMVGAAAVFFRLAIAAVG